MPNEPTPLKVDELAPGDTHGNGVAQRLVDAFNEHSKTMPKEIEERIRSLLKTDKPHVVPLQAKTSPVTHKYFKHMHHKKGQIDAEGLTWDKWWILAAIYGHDHEALCNAKQALSQHLGPIHGLEYPGPTSTSQSTPRPTIFGATLNPLARASQVESGNMFEKAQTPQSDQTIELPPPTLPSARQMSASAESGISGPIIDKRGRPREFKRSAIISQPSTEQQATKRTRDLSGDLYNANDFEDGPGKKYKPLPGHRAERQTETLEMDGAHIHGTDSGGESDPEWSRMDIPINMLSQLSKSMKKTLDRFKSHKNEIQQVAESHQRRLMAELDSVLQKKIDEHEKMMEGREEVGRKHLKSWQTGYNLMIDSIRFRLENMLQRGNELIDKLTNAKSNELASFETQVTQRDEEMKQKVDEMNASVARLEAMFQQHVTNVAPQHQEIEELGASLARLKIAHEGKVASLEANLNVSQQKVASLEASVAYLGGTKEQKILELEASVAKLQEMNRQKDQEKLATEQAIKELCSKVGTHPALN